MSTAAWIAATPSRTCSISRSSGPRTAATMQNSVAPVAAVSCAASNERRDVEPRGAHRRVEPPRLRAEVAVLRAAAGLDRDDPLDLDLRAAPAHAHLVREREHLVDAVVGQPQHLEDLLLGEADALVQHLLASHGEDVRSCHGSISLLMVRAVQTMARNALRSDGETPFRRARG